jgi:hypothetical protein
MTPSDLIRLLRRSPPLGWVVAAVALTIVASYALDVIFRSFGDVCDLGHENPNNVGGWSIAGLAVVGSIALGALLLPQDQRRWLVPAFAIVQILWFVNLLIPRGVC